MRAFWLLAGTATLAACSPQTDRGADAPTQQMSMEPSYDASGGAGAEGARAPLSPNIAPTAAPGVAFNYRYSFRLAADRIARVQEQHAAACEQLGIDRCRITGMRYRLVNDRDIQAMLVLKLDPAIARNFGREGIAQVEAAEGMLVDAEISGEDVGAQIQAGTRNLARMEEDLQRVEQQLARPGLRPAERAELQAQAEQLRNAIRAARAGQEQRRETLATTPVAFHYGSGDLAPGFDGRSPIGKAFERAGSNIVEIAAILILLLASLLPFALLAWLLWLAFRLARRRGWLPRRDEDFSVEA